MKKNRMSLLRCQGIYKCDKNNNSHKVGIELLAGSNILDKLAIIYKINNNIIKENKLKEIDYYMLNIIENNKDKIKDIKEKQKIEFVNMNLFPGTLETILSNDGKQKQLQKISNTITGIEIVEDLIHPVTYLGKNTDGFNKIIKEKLGFTLGLDDVTMGLLLDEKQRGFIIEELDNYIKKKIISFIKIDLRLTNIVIEDPKIRANLFNILFTERLGLEGTKIIFEGVETEKDLEIILDKIKKNREWIKKHNIKFYFQGFYFHKPEVIIP